MQSLNYLRIAEGILAHVLVNGISFLINTVIVVVYTIEIIIIIAFSKNTLAIFTASQTHSWYIYTTLF